MLYNLKRSVSVASSYITPFVAKYLIGPLTGRKIFPVAGFIHQYFGVTLHKNWGDELNIYLLGRLTGRMVIDTKIGWMHPIFAIGSNVDTITGNSKTYRVWGTGAMFGNKVDNQNLKIFAVRGPLTRKVLLESGIYCPEIYGDPALLLPFAYEPAPRESTSQGLKISIIPHYMDFYNPLFERLRDSLPNVKLINLGQYDNWTDVIDEICNSDLVLSSSLHGLIVSDAYGIPNVWFNRNGYAPSGHKFKFRDYQLSVRPWLKEDEINPVLLQDKLNTAQIKQWLDEYRPIKIDLQPLIDACPIKLNINRR